MMARTSVIATGAVLALALYGCGGSDGGDDGGTPLSDDTTKFITGKVLDGNTGIPIKNALITTTPPTEVRVTDRDGFYEIKDETFQGTVYDVTATQIGYDSDTKRISVNAGGFGNADFTIVTSVNGLVSNLPTLQIPLGATSGTFLLSTTLDNTQFSFQTTDPAFQVKPSQGTLSKNQLLVITVEFTPTDGVTGLVAGQVIANTQNGGTGIEVNVSGNVPPEDVVEPSDPFQVLVDPEGELIDAATNPDDIDADSVLNAADNCPSTPNPGQVNSDSDAQGDACDSDDDNDGVADENDPAPTDPAIGPGTASTDSEDTDGDGVSNDMDNCPSTPNPEQANADGDTQGDVCDLGDGIDFGNNVVGTLDSNSDVNIHEFEANGGDELVIPFVRISGGNLTLLLEVRDSAGTVLMSESGVRGTVSGKIPTSGKHFLWVSNPNNNAAGDYEFTLQRANNPPKLAPISFGDNVESLIKTNSDIAIHPFTGAAGDKLVIPYVRLSGGNLTLQVDLRNSSGAVLFSSSGVTGILEGTIPDNGEYTLWINNPNHNAAGNFEFTLQRSNNPTALEAITFGSTTNSTLDINTDIDIHPFTAQAGDQLLVPFVRISGGNLTLLFELRDDVGTVLQTASGVTGTLMATIPDNGTYYFWVTNPNHNAAGEYEFSLRRTNNP